MFNKTNTIVKIVVVSRMITTNRTIIKFDFRVKIKHNDNFNQKFYTW